MTRYGLIFLFALAAAGTAIAGSWKGKGWYLWVVGRYDDGTMQWAGATFGPYDTEAQCNAKLAQEAREGGDTKRIVQVCNFIDSQDDYDEEICNAALFFNAEKADVICESSDW